MVRWRPSFIIPCLQNFSPWCSWTHQSIFGPFVSTADVGFRMLEVTDRFLFGRSGYAYYHFSLRHKREQTANSNRWRINSNRIIIWSHSLCQPAKHKFILTLVTLCVWSPPAPWRIYLAFQQLNAPLHSESSCLLYLLAVVANSSWLLWPRKMLMRWEWTKTVSWHWVELHKGRKGLHILWVHYCGQSLSH